ncbi:MAG: tetratricopeptide repeat protein, partial [Candidatus Nitrosopolaris sp.]
TRLCQQVGDQTCISAERNFKMLFVQTTQNASGDWVSNGAVQNISPDSLEQVIATLHLYDCSGRIVGYTEGFTIPYNFSSMQTAIFNQTISPTNLTGTPKFFRVSFDSASVSNSTAYNALPPPVSNSTAYNAMPVITTNNVTANNIGALNNKENALEHLGNYTGAMAMADKVLAIDPHNLYALKSKGVALNYLGDYRIL